MPWSPVPKFPDVIADLKRQGYAREVNFSPLQTAIMRQIGLIRDSAIKQTIKAMEQLGYLKMSENGLVWKICQGTPGNFGERKKRSGRTPEQEADDLLETIGGGKRDRKRK